MSTRDGDQPDEGFDMLFVISETAEGGLTGRIYRGKRQMEQVKDIAEQVAGAMREPRMRGRMENFRRSVRLGNPSFALADGSLPEGATVVVVRDPNVTPNRLIVVKRGAPELEVRLGRSTLRQSEIAEPEVARRTVILRWADGRYAVMHGGVMDRSGTAAWRYLGDGKPSIDTRQSVGGSEGELLVPELGVVHLVG